MSMNSLLAVLLAVSAALNGYLIYGEIDSSITASHQSDALRWRTDQLDVLSALTLNSFKDESRSLLTATAELLKLPLTEDGEAELWIGQVFFKFTGDRLVSIDYY